jgi:hypothetical protein
MVEADHPFVLSTWLRTASQDPRIDEDTFFSEHQRAIKSLLPRATAVVACAKDDPEQLFGYVVANPPDTLHYLFTKNWCRRMGIGRRLMVEAFGDATPTETSNTSKAWSSAASAMGIKARFNPYAMAVPRQEEDQ